MAALPKSPQALLPARATVSLHDGKECCAALPPSMNRYIKKDMTTSPSAPDVLLWLRPEVFTCGTIPVAPHPRINHNNIKKIVGYAKSKGQTGHPNLCFSVWKHIACNKLQLNVDVAWMFFELYFLMNHSAEERLSLDEKLAACSTTQDIEKVRMNTCVNLLRFVVLLFIQQVHRMSLKASIIAGDEWPVRSKSPDLEGRSTPGSKGLEEHAHMSFLLNNINDIMELLVEPDSYVGDRGNDLSLSLEAVEVLSMVIEGSADKNKTIKPLHELAMMQAYQQKSGFHKISRSFSFRTLQSWLSSHVVQSPFGVSSCLANGRRLSWYMADDRDKTDTSHRRGRIATNAHLVPRHHLKRHKVIIMSQVCRQAIARSSKTLEGACIKIHRCHNSFLYLLSPMRYVSIEKCRNTTVVLGAVETAVHVQNCEQLTVIAACRRVTISGSTLCTFHLLTPRRPLILAGNDSIILAPYHTFYGKLDEHLVQAGLAVKPNLWNQAFCVGPDHHDNTRVFEILPASDFYLFSIPFDVSGPTKGVPCEIPPSYQAALVSREKAIENWQQAVKEAGLTKQQRKQFQSLVQTRFQVWLAETGNKKHLDALVTSADKPKPVDS